MITLLNAHASKTPHLVGQVAKAELLIADRLELWGSPHATERAAQLVAALQDLGWAPPRDITDPPPPPSYSTKAGRERARQIFEETRAATTATSHAPQTSTTDGRHAP